MLQAGRSRARDPDEVNEFFSIYVILQVALGPGVYLAANRNEYQKEQMFLGSTELLVLRADNLTAICEPIV
jgi:hypothetical protein